jgi:hypothetical protein
LKIWNRAHRRVQKAHKEGVAISNQLYHRREKPLGFGAPRASMLHVIASESRSPEEFARRAEAWAATEAKPPTVATIARAWRKGSPAQITRLLQKAKQKRLAHTQARWRGYVNEPEDAENLID